MLAAPPVIFHSMAPSPAATWRHFSAMALLSLLSLSFPTISEASNLSTDASALLKFKEGISSDPSSLLVSWRASPSSSSPCHWLGVTCTSGRVTALNFIEAGFKGYLAPELGDMDELTQLGLGGSSLSGPVPEPFGNLKSLRVLNLSQNSFEGSFPKPILRLTLLEELDLSFNFFVGSIPSNIGNLSLLRVLNLGDNSFSGKIPNSMWELLNLETLRLSNNALTGPLSPGIGNLTNATHVYFSMNYLSGHIPSHVGNMKSVKSLWLDNNIFGGPIPPEIGKLPNLESLNLNFNQLNGSIPPNLFDPCLSLFGIGIHHNLLTGPLPSTLQNCFVLSYFFANDNQLSGNLSAQVDWSFFSLLEEVALDHNLFFGPLPPSIGFEGSLLSQLLLSFNNLTGPIPESYAFLSELTVLDLSSNPLNCTLNPILSNCTALEAMYLQNSSLYGPIPTEFGNLLNMTFLGLQSNSLSGPIPGELFSCCIYKNFSIWLDDNRLNGSLPPNFANTNLEELSVPRNRLSGPLPDVFGGCRSLTRLQIQSNFFTGPLPPSLSNVTTLTYFHAEHNAFNGSIPPNLFNPILYELDLSDNSFSGPLPSFGPSLVRLIYLNLSHNQFENVEPLELSLQNSLNILDLSSNKLEGALSVSSDEVKDSPLITLALSHNLLNGSIPSSLATLKELSSLTLSHNNFDGTIPTELRTLTLLQNLSLSNNKLTGGVPLELGNLSLLGMLELDNNLLSGPIPPHIANCTILSILRLSNNELSGRIPAELGNLSALVELNLSSNFLTGKIPDGLSGLSLLKIVDFSNNELSGPIPVGNLSNFTALAFANNRGLCGLPLELCRSSKTLSAGAVAGIVIGALVLTASIVLVVLYLMHQHWRSILDKGTLELYHKLPFRLTYASILQATDNWSDEALLGTGGFGSVYRAVLADGETMVAIKRLAEGSSQGLKELRTEIRTLGQLKHRNLVKLIGSYTSESEALLIYEFLPGGDLESHLYGNKSEFDNWVTRYNVLLGAANGLKYLHHNNKPAIIHRDIKPPNILLDNDLEARVADFGLAREINIDKQTHLSTAVSGTVGYMPVEYFQLGLVTPKIDVYAFGVVILQVLTGKRPTDVTLGEEGLPHWLSELWCKGRAREALDPKMRVEEGEVMQVMGTLKLGLMCSSKRADSRPTMEEVVLLLEHVDMFGLKIDA